MKKLILLILLILALPFLSVLTSCDHKTSAWGTMDKAETLMNTHPDSAYSILSLIDKNKLGDDEEKARYALLMSMALDKNYIDTTTFDVLQPAIDYYLSKGNPDERLRTLYYQGRIFLNQSDFDMAMQCFLKATDLRSHCTDTLTYANMLVAQSILNFFSYQIEDYVSNNLAAAYLYERLNKDRYRQSSLIKALDGSIALKDKPLSDSILAVVDSLSIIVPESGEESALVRQTYSITFEPNHLIASMLDTISDYSMMNDASKLNMAAGYLKLNQYKKADDVLKRIAPNSEIGKSFRYLQLKPLVLEASGKYREALAAYRTYVDAINKDESKIFYQKTTVAQELHEVQVNHLYTLQAKDKQIWLSLCVLLVLIIIIGVVYYQYRIGKAKRVLSEKEQSRLQLENENLYAKNKVLELEKYNASLEREKHNLASENMALRITQLESESESLRALLTKAELSKPILDAIQERMEMLNGVFAAHITSDENFSKPYDKWISEVTADKDKFINSTRLAFRASHPKFMSYLDSKGLTESELNYVCLYALGLRGKDVGEYIQIKRHYHISSDVRKKLGLKDSDTNLGLYIRKLMKDL